MSVRRSEEVKRHQWGRLRQPKVSGFLVVLTVPAQSRPEATEDEKR